MKKIACIRLLAGMTALVMLSGVLTAAAEDPKPRKPMAAQGPALARILAPTAASAPRAAFTYDDVPSNPIAISDQTTCGGGEIVRTFNVAGSFTVVDVKVGFNASHTHRGDIRVSLQSPAGTRV
jgi:hypothetical protein